SNSVVARNFTILGGVNDILGAPTIGSVNNFIGDGSGLTGITDGTNGNHVGTAAAPLDPRLGPLQDNGGPTQTLAPLANSRLIGAGSNDAVRPGVTTDQRGFVRIVGDAVDIGAVEFQPQEVAVTLASSANPAAAGSSITFTATLTPSAPGPRNTPTGSV